MKDRDENSGEQSDFAPGWRTDASPQIIARAMRGETLSFSPDDQMPHHRRAYIPVNPSGQDSQGQQRGWIDLGKPGVLPAGNRPGKGRKTPLGDIDDLISEEFGK